MKRIVVCDLDGTLCNTDHRTHFLTQRPRVLHAVDEFHSRLSDDTPCKPVQDLLHLLGSNHTTIIFNTGRPERYRAETIRWLNTYINWWDLLLMRPEKNYEPDEIIKPQALERIIEKPSDVSFILEDRDRMVARWRELGYTCFQVKPGEY